jgi:hypothetical protein
MSTDDTRRAIAAARELATPRDADAIREYTGTVSDEPAALAMAYAQMAGKMQYWLAELANIAEQLEGDNSRLRNDRARYRAQLHLAPDADDREALREAGQPGRLGE